MNKLLKNKYEVSFELYYNENAYNNNNFFNVLTRYHDKNSNIITNSLTYNLSQHIIINIIDIFNTSKNIGLIYYDKKYFYALEYMCSIKTEYPSTVYASKHLSGMIYEYYYDSLIEAKNDFYYRITQMQNALEKNKCNNNIINITDL